MAVFAFAPGEHDEWVCMHIMQGRTPVAVEHKYERDGSVTVEFPGIPEREIAEAIGNYDRAEYDKPEPTRDEQLAAAFEVIGKDPGLAPESKSAISQAVTLLRGEAR